MATLAKAYWLLCCCNDTPKPQSICHNKWAIWLVQEKICKNFEQVIPDRIKQERLEMWWTRTKKLTVSQIQSIDFATACQARKRYGLQGAVMFRNSPPSTRPLDRICADGASGRQTSAPDAWHLTRPATMFFNA
jgi:hypothetical protein